jgi:beta-lactamase class A
MLAGFAEVTEPAHGLQRARRRSTHLLGALLIAAGCAPAQPAVEPEPIAGQPKQAFDSDLAPLEDAIRARLADEPGEFGIAVIDIETGRTAGFNERLVVHAASTMKVPVLLELYRRAGTGAIRLDDPVPIRNRFRSIADTSHYSLSTDDDSELTLYARIGETVTLRELARLMTVRSSNLATNLLIEILGAPSIRETNERAGGFGMHVLRGVEDTPAFRAGLNNSTTALGFARGLAAIARCDMLPAAECAEIIDVLAAQEFKEMIPAGLPSGTRVANKTGWITGIQHDGAIVMPERSPPFVLAMLSRGGRDTLAVRAVARDIARLTWNALGPGGSLRPAWPAASAEMLSLHARVRVPAFPAPTLSYDEYWSTLGPIADRTPSITREVVGASGSGRPIHLLRTGRGATRVLLWSQMHGDETTASRALADVFNFIALYPEDARVRRWQDNLTLLAVPLLNPDGADAHRRRNAFGIDINRDARALSTPEARALKSVQERYTPAFGFNLHDQNPRARAGSADRTAAISLLAPAPDADGTMTPSFVRARRLTAFISGAVAPFVGDHLTRYDDSYNARAFGDLMQSWGVSTVLIETGSWRGDESKHFLRSVNFAAITSALDAIASGAYETTDERLYTSLPENGRSLNDLIVQGGTLVVPGLAPVRADIAIDAAAVGGPAVTQIVDVGDLSGSAARDTIDARGLFVHAAAFQPGTMPLLRIRRGAEPDSELIWEVEGVRARRFTARR